MIANRMSNQPAASVRDGKSDSIRQPVDDRVSGELRPQPTSPRGRGVCPSAETIHRRLGQAVAKALALPAGSLLALLLAGGCGGKPAPTPPGAEKTTPAIEIEMGDTPADASQAPAKSSAAEGAPADEQPEDSDTEKDK